MVVTLIATTAFASDAPSASSSKPAGARAAAAAIKSIEGVYKTRFANSTVHEEHFVSEDILEIVPYTADKIYFRLHLEFFNAHICDLFGIARYEDGSFVFHGPPAVSEEPCILKIRARKGSVTLDDVGSNCRGYSCGARGGYQGAGFPMTSRRAIRYMQLLTASREYAEAITEFEDLAKSPPSGEKR